MRRHGWYPDRLGDDCLLRGESGGWRGWCGSECAGELPLVRSLEARHGWTRPECSHRRWWRTRRDRERVVLPGLGGEETLCRSTMPFAFAIFFEGVLDGNGLVHEELAIHGFDCRVRGLEVGV